MASHMQHPTGASAGALLLASKVALAGRGHSILLVAPRPRLRSRSGRRIRPGFRAARRRGRSLLLLLPRLPRLPLLPLVGWAGGTALASLQRCRRRLPAGGPLFLSLLGCAPSPPGILLLLPCRRGWLVPWQPLRLLWLLLGLLLLLLALCRGRCCSAASWLLLVVCRLGPECHVAAVAAAGHT